LGAVGSLLSQCGYCAASAPDSVRWRTDLR